MNKTIDSSFDLQQKLTQKIDPDNIDAKRRETTFDFETKIAAAQMDGSEWVETTPEVIAYFNKKGLGTREDGTKVKHFVYKNINVCEYGKLEEAKADIERPFGKKLQGTTATVEGLR